MENAQKLIDVNDFERKTEHTMSIKEVCTTCLYLGVTSFGGPIAHIGMYNRVFIQEKKIISEKEFLQLFAICNIIPGPSSAQLITSIATIKSRSLLGGIVGFLCFNMPALIVMVTIASVMTNTEESHSGQGGQGESKLVNSALLGIWQGAVALVLQAALSLSKKVSNSNTQILIVLVSAVAYFIFRNYYVMLTIMLFSGLFSLMQKEEQFLIKKNNQVTAQESNSIPFLGTPALFTFIVFYLFIFLLNLVTEGATLNIFLMEKFYRIGATVIGGGHVVIPLVLSEFKNLISEKGILNAFSIVSCLPGPMFNISGYIGTLINGKFTGFLSAISIFLPGMLLLFTALKFIDYIEARPDLQFFIRGLSSAAIGFIFTSCAILYYDSCLVYTSHCLFGTLNVALAYYLLEYKNFNVILVLAVNVILSILLHYI